MPAAWYPGMQGCHRLRGRKAGSALYLDVHIEVCPLQLFLSDLSWLTCAATLLIKYLLLWFIEPYESFKFHHIKLYNNEVLMCILFMNTCWSSDMFYCGIISSSILNCFIFIVGRATNIFMHLPLVLLWHYRMSYPKFCPFSWIKKHTILGVKFVHLQKINELAFQNECVDQPSDSHWFIVICGDLVEFQNYVGSANLI